MASRTEVGSEQKFRGTEIAKNLDERFYQLCCEGSEPPSEPGSESYGEKAERTCTLLRYHKKWGQGTSLSVQITSCVRLLDNRAQDGAERNATLGGQDESCGGVMTKIRPSPQHTSCRITTGVITAITANASLVADDGYAGRADGTTAVVAERKENGGWGRGQLRGAQGDREARRREGR